MAKSQKNGNREAKKPKAKKPIAATEPALILASGSTGNPKKKK